jgi:hypothetical protein
MRGRKLRAMKERVNGEEKVCGERSATGEENH